MRERIDSNKEDEPTKPRRNQISVDDFKKRMSEEEMEAFAAACRIKYGTALAEDYLIVTRYEKMLSSRRRDDTGL